MSFHTEFYAKGDFARSKVEGDVLLPPLVKLILRDALHAYLPTDTLYVKAFGHIPRLGFGEYQPTSVDIQVHKIEVLP